MVTNLALSDFDNPRLWREDLDNRWPERTLTKQVLLDHLFDSLTGLSNPILLELGIGDGELMSTLIEKLPTATLVAMDLNQTLIDHCATQLPKQRVSFRRTDLSEPWATGMEANFDAIYSLQSLHDFGGIAVLRATYAEMAKALKPGGIAINADFVEQMPHDDPKNPCRFETAVHIEILNDCGFENAKVLSAESMLACITATRSQV